MNTNTGIIQIVKEKYSKLNVRQKEIAKYILDNYSEVCFMSATQIGKKLNTSQSSVLRLSSILGYKSFNGMQEDLRNLMKEKITLTSFLQRIKKGSVNNKKNILESLYLKNIENDLENIEYLQKNISTETINEIIKLILAAKNIFILGFRSSTSVANFLGIGLTRILRNVRVLNNTKCDIFDQILDINEGDVLIGFCFDRYTREAVNVYEYVKSKRVKTISFTDNILVPFSSYSDILVHLKVNSIGFIYSQVGVMCLLNYLLAAIVAKKGKKGIDKLKEFEKNQSKYKIFYSEE